MRWKYGAYGTIASIVIGSVTVANKVPADWWDVIAIADKKTGTYDV